MDTTSNDASCVNAVAQRAINNTAPTVIPRCRMSGLYTADCIRIGIKIRRQTMKAWAIAALLLAQSGKEAVDTHVAAAKTAAGQEHTSIFGLCTAPAPAPPASTTAAQRGQRAATQPPGPPDPSQWHAEPVKVFDNLYFVGMTEYSVWAVNTSEGIILIDAIYDYSIEDEVAKGLPKVGLDPNKIKYVIVSHGHIDHAGGAKFLQDRYGARVIMGP